MTFLSDIMTIFLALLCTAMPIWCGNRHGVIKYFSPMHLCAGMAALGITLKILTYQFYPKIAFHLRYTQDPYALFWGTVYITFFIGAMCFGYLLFCRRRIHVKNLFVPEQLHALRFPPLILPTAIMSILLVTDALFSQRGLSVFDPNAYIVVNTVKQFSLNENNVGSTGALVKVFYVIPRVLFVLCVLRAMATGKKSVIQAAMTTFVALVFAALASGDRFDLARLLLFTGISLVCAGWVFKARSVAFGIALTLIIVTSAGMMSSLRKSNLSDTVDLSLLSGLVDVTEQITGSTYFMDVNISTILVDVMDPEYTLYGESYTWWTFGWIPRALWPGKPSTDVGTYLKRDILGHGSNSIGAFNVTGPGEAFINFRWFGILVGCVLGILFRWIELIILFHKHTRRHTFIYYPVVAMPLIISCLQSSFSAGLVSAIIAAILTAITKGIFLSDIKRSRQSSLRIGRRHPESPRLG